jgi:pre-mRNA-splicing factor 38A
MAHQADAKRALDERGYTGALIHGDNPLKLFEKPVRDRIVESYYWKEQCFGLNAATILDRATELTFIGGTYGIAQKPTPFLCLAFKLLQITPDREIIMFYLEQEEYKYLRALAAFYIRLAWEKDEDVYRTLEPYLNDMRKLKRRTREGWALTHVCRRSIRGCFWRMRIGWSRGRVLWGRSWRRWRMKKTSKMLEVRARLKKLGMGMRMCGVDLVRRRAR